MTTPRRTKKPAEAPQPPTKVLAIQVKRPYRSVTHAFPRSHRHNKTSGAFDYFRLLDAEEGKNRAYDGDWIVKLEDGTALAMRDTEFKALYEVAE